MMTNHASYASTETACAKTRAVMEGRMRSDEHQLKGASRGGAARDLRAVDAMCADSLKKWMALLFVSQHRNPL